MELEKEAGISESSTIYSVLMYPGGCTLIPHTWVNLSDKTYNWPAKPVLSRSKMHELTPNATWRSHKYNTHLGPYYTYDEALKVESICTALSSNEDSEALSNIVSDVLQSKKRITKTTKVYSDSEVQPPTKYIKRESQKQLGGQILPDLEAIPPANYLVRSNSQNETPKQSFIESGKPHLSNQGKSSNPDDEDFPSNISANNQRSSKFIEERHSTQTPDRALQSPIPSTSTEHLHDVTRKIPPAHNDMDSNISSGRLILVPVFHKNGNACYIECLDSLLCKNEANFNKNTKKPCILESTVVTTLPPGIKAVLRNHRQDESLGKDVCSADEVSSGASTISNNPRKQTRKQTRSKCDEGHVLSNTRSSRKRVLAIADSSDSAASVLSEAESIRTKRKSMVRVCTNKKASPIGSDNLNAQETLTYNRVHTQDKTARRQNSPQEKDCQKQCTNQGREEIHDTMENQLQVPHTSRNNKNVIPKRKTVGGMCPDCKGTCCLRIRTLLKVLVDKVNKLIPQQNYDDGCNDDDDEGRSFLPQFPLKTMGQVTLFEALLRREEEARKQYCNAIRVIGGRNLKKFVGRVLEYVLVDELARQYTWTGIRNTKKVKNMKFIDLMTVTLVKKVKGSTIAEVMGYAQEWFRRAGDRIRTSMSNADK